MASPTSSHAAPFLQYHEPESTSLLFLHHHHTRTRTRTRIRMHIFSPPPAVETIAPPLMHLQSSTC